MRTHKDLDVWKNAMDLVTCIYDETKSFPKEEMYGLTNQIRRAAVSIPSNIAEGSGRSHNKEFINFLYIALGSLAELETQLMIANNLKMLSVELLERFLDKMNLIRGQLSGLIKYRKSQNKKESEILR